jgi:hypothetical protein
MREPFEPPELPEPVEAPEGLPEESQWPPSLDFAEMREALESLELLELRRSGESFEWRKVRGRRESPEARRSLHA